MQRTDACGGVIRQLGGMMTWHEGKEESSVMANFHRHTAFLDSPVIADHVSSTSFDPMILRRGRATVYLILPHDKLSSLSALQRLWVSTLLRVITAGTPTERNPVLWLLDECAHLGKLQAIEDAVTLMRGMGMRLWFFFQSLDQLQKCFGDAAPAVLDNIGTQQYFNLTSYTTAERLSKRIGDATVATWSRNGGRGESWPTGPGPHGPQPGSRSSNDGWSRSDFGRPFIRPDEILRLERDVCMVLHKNMPVMLTRLVKYYEAPEFRWGRSGRAFSLAAPAAAVMSAVMLATGLLVVGAAASLPPPEPVPVPLLDPAFRASPYPSFGSGPYYGPPPYRRRVMR